jgi:hypothetical protein
MRLAPVFIALTMVPEVALACSFITDERSNFQIMMESRPVQQLDNCAFDNAGVYDQWSAREAENIGHGRIAQRLWGSRSALIVDCNTREATILEGPSVQMVGPDGEELSDSCGPTYFTYDIIGPDAVVSLADGANLTEMVATAVAAGARESDPVERYLTDPWGDPVWPRDRVDLLCGCSIFYPDSQGAGQ